MYVLPRPRGGICKKTGGGDQTMASYITVDSGTTNTRISLVTDGVILDTLKFGVPASGEGTRRERLSGLLKDGIAALLNRNRTSAEEICRILACGMITSEIGLIELDHIKAPCGIRELAEHLYETTIKEISDIPFVFIRGIKYVSDDRIDMMRGEETEIYGISESPKENSLYVLPGSHSKLIYMDRENRISEFSTELTGEMIHAIANHTILSGVIDLEQAAEDGEYLQKGYLYCKEHGMNAALFNVRPLKRHAGATDAQAFSFFIGALLAPEIDNIIKSPAERIVIGGKPQLKEPTFLLLKMNSAKQIEKVSAGIAEHATVYGAIRIYESAASR